MALHTTFDTLTMVMVGGLGTIAGPILGAVALTFLSEWLRYFEELLKMDIRLIIYGLLLILTILFMRDGLAGVLRGGIDRFKTTCERLRKKGGA